jgi:hypothetical protein
MAKKYVSDSFVKTGGSSTQFLKADGGISEGISMNDIASELKATTNLGNVSGSVAINWALGIQYNLTMTGATTLTFSNMVQGKTITLIVTGNYTLAFPASVKGDITGFVGTKTNQVQLYCFDGTTPQCSVGILNW